MALLLLVAGFETTVNLIGNGTVALLGDPDGWDRLRQDPALVPAAVEEMLRYDSPVQLTSRIATEDVEVGGAVIAAGRSVVVFIGGANRDPEVFERPDEFRIARAYAAGTCPSRSACITAWAPRWPGWRAASPSRS
jgi:cytochrome P450